MTALYLKPINQLLIELSDSDLLSLQNSMEEESSKDQDYFIDLTTVDLIRGAGASEGLINALTKVIGQSDGVEVEWR